MPRVPTQPVAVGAVAAATALTLANPDLAGKRPENPGDTRDRPTRTRSEPVPADVLDRLDDQSAHPGKAPAPPDCAPPARKAARAGSDGKELELLPNIVYEGDAHTAPARKCREPDEPREPREPGKQPSGQAAE